MKTRKRLSTRILTFMLAFAMVFTTMSFMPDVGVQEVSAATGIVPGSVPAPRTTAPSTTNKYYKSPQGGYKREGYGNCTWYAYSRAREALGVSSVNMLSYLGNGGDWYGKVPAKNKGKTPRPGSILCLGYYNGPGHVAFVEKVKSNGDIYISNMGYSSIPRWGGETVTGNSKTGYLSAGWLPHNRYAWWSSAYFQGFIYLNICKHTSFNTKTGVCNGTGCNETYYHFVTINDSIKTVVPEKMFKVNNEGRGGAWIRKYPSTTANHSGTFKYNGTSIVVGGYITVNGERWYKVKVGEDRGFMQAACISGPAKAEYSTSTIKISGFKDINLKKPQPTSIKGKVTSNYPLKYVKGYLDGKSIAKECPSGKEYTIANNKIDRNIKCGNFKPNSYHVVKIVASDGVKEITSEILIKVGSPKVAPPKITRYKAKAVKSSMISANASVDVSSGKRLEIEQATEGATLHYVIGDQAERTTTDMSVITPPITEEGTTLVKAWSTKDGEKSVVTEYEVEVSKLAAPYVEVKQNEDKAVVTINASEGATAYYKVNSGSYIAYDGTPFEVNDGDSISAYSKRDGYINSDIETVEIELDRPDVPELALSNADSTVPVDGVVSFTWGNDNKASSYEATLYNEDDEVVETIGITRDENNDIVPAASFKLQEAGDYYVSVVASNELGDSEASNEVAVSAKDNLTVTFMDGDTELDSFEIKYGETIGEYKSDNEISQPSKKGFNFTGWEDADTGIVSSNEFLNTPIKKDMTYIANFEEKVYSVKIYAADGTYKTTQKVKYHHALDVEALKGELGLQEGDTVSWQVVSTADETSNADINSIDSDMEVKANVYLDEFALPIVIENENVTSNENHVSATFTMRKLDNTELADKKLKFYLIYALKIKDDTLGVDQTAYVDRKVVYLSGASANESIDIDLNDIEVDGINFDDISKLEITAVEMKSDMTTGNNYSKTASADVFIRSGYGAWSSWQTTKPADADDRQIESKTQYQSRTKSYVNDGHDTLSGYTLESKGTPTVTKSNWYVSAPSSMSSTTYSGAYKVVVNTESKTAHKSYAYFCDCKKWFWKNNGGVCKYCGKKTTNTLTLYTSGKPTYSIDSSDNSYIMPATVSTKMDKVGTVYRMYENGTGTDSWTSKSSSGHTYMWDGGTKTVYRNTTTKTTNKFYKWGAWSAWGDNAISAGSNTEVNTRTVYRYRDASYEEKAPASLEGKKVYHAQGTLGFDVPEGSDSTVMVYQTHNTDPNKYQVQYAGTTKIGADNSYDFRFVLKEEPTEESGNYIVAMSVPGVSGLVQLDVIDENGNIKHCIEAPKPHYSVNLFYNDADGNKNMIREGIIVGEHDNVKLSDVEVPKRDGYIFTGWGSRTTDITSDCVNTSNTDSEGRKVVEIEATYAPILNSVVFVDYVNKSVSLVTNIKTGDKIAYPESAESTDGYKFVGWKLEDGTVLTPDPLNPANNLVTVPGNMIITAIYDTTTYTVKFLDVNDDVLDSQEVEFGHAATPPAYSPYVEDGAFAGWSTDTNWWNVQEDVVVRPIIAYTDKARKPSSSIIDDEIEVDGNIVETSYLVLESDEENAEIYYTTDESIPTSYMIQEYKSADKESYKGSVQLYTEPITLDISDPEEIPVLNVNAVAYVPGKDLSDTRNVVFTSDGETGVDLNLDNSGTEWNKLDSCMIKSAPGKDVTVAVDLENNPGLTGYDFVIESDKDTFYLGEDEYGDPVVEAGDASANGSISVSNTEDGWNVLWSSTDGNSTDGNLFTLTLHTDEEAEVGEYPVDVYYAPSHTYDLDYDKTDLKNVKVNVSSDAYTDISKLDVSLSKSTYTFSNSECKPSVRIDGLTVDEDYTVEYVDNINAGTAKVIVTGINDYIGTVEKEFTITPASMTDVEIADIEAQAYKGSPVEPTLDVKFYGTPLEAGKDYEAEFENNNAVGTAKVTLTGKGNYKDVSTIQFAIVAGQESELEEAKRKLAEAEAAKKEAEDKLAAAEAAKTEAENKLAAAETAKETAEKNLAEANKALEEAQKQAEEGNAEAQAKIDELTAAKAEAESKLAAAEQAKNEADNKLAAAETAKAEADERAAAAEQKAADAEKALEEVKENAVITLSTITVSGIKNKTYTGSEITQDIVVKCGDVELVNGIDYDVEYQNNIKVGKATLTVVGKGKYTGSFSKTFKINPKGISVSKLTRGKKAFTVKWKKQSTQTTGYQIRYSLKSSMSSSKTVTVSGTSTVSKTIKKLKAKKKYYVQVRTYKTVSGTKYYSSWSSKKSVTTK